MKKAKHKAKLGEAVFITHNSPFENLTEEQTNSALKEIAKKCADDFSSQFEKLNTIIKSYNAIHILSVLSSYGMSLAISKHGAVRSVVKHSVFSQSHIEIIQALSLTQKNSDKKLKIANPEIIQEIIDIAVETSRNFSLRRLSQIESAKNEKSKYILRLQEEIRNHTHFVRNWGHFKQVKEICRSIYKNLDNDFKQLAGIECTKAIRIFEIMIEQVETRLTERQRKFQIILKTKNNKDLVNSYCEQFQLQGREQELLKTLEYNNIPVNQAKFLLLSHSELILADVYLFSIQHLAKDINVTDENVYKFMSNIGYRFGDLELEKPEAIFLDNPIWTKPVIIINREQVFCPIPSMFFSFIFNIIGNIFKLRASSAVKHEKRRAEFLETKAAELLSAAFPSCAYARNVKLKTAQIEYESDFVMRVDSYIILAEMKSGSISGPALRGAPMRIKRHIDELIIDPSIQSSRIASMLLEIRDHTNTSITISPTMPFDLKGIHKVIRLSITLEDFATIQSNVTALKGTHWVDEAFTPAVSMTLSDLELVLNTLSRQSEKIHYFVRRAELQENMYYKGDELDLLGFYIDNRFCVGDIEHNGTTLVLTGMSKKIDDYYIALENGFNRKTPKIKLTKWWGDILDHIENKQFQRWSEAAVILLDISFKDQVYAERLIKKIAKNVNKRTNKTNVNNSAVLQPPKWKSNAIAFIAILDSQWGRRHDLMRDIALTSFSEGHAIRCLVIAINIERRHYPYSVLGWFERNTE